MKRPFKVKVPLNLPKAMKKDIKRVQKRRQDIRTLRRGGKAGIAESTKFAARYHQQVS